MSAKMSKILEKECKVQYIFVYFYNLLLLKLTAVATGAIPSITRRNKSVVVLLQITRQHLRQIQHSSYVSIQYILY